MKSRANKIAVIVASFALVVSVVLTVSMYLLSTQLQDMRKDSFITNAQLGYTSSKLQFCVDNGITPCDDAAITAWNELHANGQFSVKTYQQITEDGITEYEASRR